MDFSKVSLVSYEVEKFIRKAIACNMIRPSDAPAWSQILLTPKKNGSYRFCVDFRALNNATHSSGWPLPNIKHVLDRLSKKKPKYFTVLDLTSGYFQIPIHEQSRILTAFRTTIGLFEWNRLPMGLKGAGSYFQMQMHVQYQSPYMWRSFALQRPSTSWRHSARSWQMLPLQSWCPEPPQLS